MLYLYVRCQCSIVCVIAYNSGYSYYKNTRLGLTSSDNQALFVDVTPDPPISYSMWGKVIFKWAQSPMYLWYPELGNAGGRGRGRTLVSSSAPCSFKCSASLRTHLLLIWEVPGIIPARVLAILNEIYCSFICPPGKCRDISLNKDMTDLPT